MNSTRSDIPETTRTTVDILLGPDNPRRQARVAEIAAIYQPVLRGVAASFLLKHAGNGEGLSEVEDLAGNEVLLMLDPGRDYFSTYDPIRGRLRHWIKSRIRRHVLDHWRKRRKLVASELDEEHMHSESQIVQCIDELEVNEVFRLAMRLTAEHYAELGQSERYEAYKELKSGQERSSGVQAMGEWEMRTIKSEVASYIRQQALWRAALTVSDNPEDVYELAGAVWDRAKNKKTLDLDF
ncbi:hypothetical protein [Ruficoccus sp. ZRK36]|uniref:hypothetical protein n=1 Tax=Ruficoccus sp. ZRK36 TaxID=2866311 RepID=UPI001C72BD23|nr:hypothetical protein [Ruficoccus sp. ZRK36]QYY37414.1 hypothetical protein K0V07_07990 [Ruficoccus sp. ZRK36]